MGRISTYASWAVDGHKCRHPDPRHLVVVPWRRMPSLSRGTLCADPHCHYASCFHRMAKQWPVDRPAGRPRAASCCGVASRHHHQFGRWMVRPLLLSGGVLVFSGAFQKLLGEQRRRRPWAVPAARMIPVGSPALQLLHAGGSSSWLAVGRILGIDRAGKVVDEKLSE